MSQADTLARTQLRRVVAEQLRQAIHAGELKPGEWLRQEQLALKFGVSQMPVREALQDLAAEGMVEHVPYRGIRIIEFSLADLLDLYAARAFLEGRTAHYAAQTITAEQVGQLKSLIDEMERQLAKKNVADYRRANRDFHQLIYSASGHAYLIRTLDQMWNTFPTMLLGNFPATATRAIPRRDVSDKQEHLAIVAALESRDAKRAERLMRAHIEESGRRIAVVLKAQK